MRLLYIIHPISYCTSTELWELGLRAFKIGNFVSNLEVFLEPAESLSTALLRLDLITIVHNESVEGIFHLLERGNLRSKPEACVPRRRSV